MRPADHEVHDWSKAEAHAEHEEKKDAFWWWLGCSVLRGPRHTQKALAVVGAPGSGKSTFCSVVSDLWPEEQRCSLNLQRVDKDPSFLAATAGKRMMVCSELPNLAVNNVEQVKSLITGNDDVTARHLYGKPFTFRHNAAILVGMNVWPTMSDWSGGLWRRFLCLRMNNILHDTGAEIIGLDKKLVEERMDVVRYAIRRAVEFMAEGRNPNPKTSVIEIEDARASSDPIAAFLLEQQDMDSEPEWVKSSDVYDAYRSWCERTGRAPISSTKFGKGLRARNTPKKRSRGGNFYQVRPLKKWFE
jgi:putative DNA primase/helicase